MAKSKNGGLRPNGIQEYRPSKKGTGARSGKMEWSDKGKRKSEKKR